MTMSDYPMADGLQPLFPTLIGKGMQYFELKSDLENGSIAKSDTPKNVSQTQFVYLSFFKHRSVLYSAEVKQLVDTTSSWASIKWPKCFIQTRKYGASYLALMVFTLVTIWRSLENIWLYTITWEGSI